MEKVLDNNGQPAILYQFLSEKMIRVVEGRLPRALYYLCPEDMKDLTETESALVKDIQKELDASEEYQNFDHLRRVWEKKMKTSGKRYFYSISEETNMIDLWCSPGHYGKTIKVLVEEANDLIHKLIMSDISDFIGGLITYDAEIYTGNSQWDKGVKRIHFRVKLLKRRGLKKALEKAKFSPVPDDFDYF